METRSLVSQKGFTLAAVLLLGAIIAVFILLGIGYQQQKIQAQQIDKTVLQAQQIFNAATYFYATSGKWPGTVNQLNCTDPALGFPNPLYPTHMALIRTLLNPWGRGYCYRGTTANTFVLQTSVANRTLATLIANKLPNGVVIGSSTVLSFILPPGQTPANAASINYAGVFHHGGCVPVPACPRDSAGVVMTPQVILVPVSVSGINDNALLNAYPISSFTAYAKGPAANPAACNSRTFSACSGSASYWRACLQVVTERGDVAVTRTDASPNFWGQNVNIAAFTRCSSTGEQSGSTFSVYSN